MFDLLFISQNTQRVFRAKSVVCFFFFHPFFMILGSVEKHTPENG